MLSREQLRFIDDLAALLAPWGMPNNSARLYGYLLLQNEPVTLDEIARDIQISRSHAHGAARFLEQHGTAKRTGERGTKRVLYSAHEKCGGPFQDQTAVLGEMASLLRQRGAKATTGPAARRIKEVSAFYAAMREAMQDVIATLDRGSARKK